MERYEESVAPFLRAEELGGEGTEEVFYWRALALAGSDRIDAAIELLESRRSAPGAPPELIERCSEAIDELREARGEASPKESGAPPPEPGAAMLGDLVVARRALCLGLMVLRSHAEAGLKGDSGSTTRFESFARKLAEWADGYGVSAWLTESETRLFRQSVGSWHDDQVFETTWRVEALAALRWALGHLDRMPSYFAVQRVDTVCAGIPVGGPVDRFVAVSRLRSHDDIERERAKAHSLDWRCRTEVLRWQGVEAPAGDSYETAIRSALQTGDDEGLALDHDGVDVLVAGRRLGDIDRAAIADIVSVCGERHLALAWVCSGDEDWDRARRDT